MFITFALLSLSTVVYTSAIHSSFVVAVVFLRREYWNNNVKKTCTLLTGTDGKPQKL